MSSAWRISLTNDMIRTQGWIHGSVHVEPATLRRYGSKNLTIRLVGKETTFVPGDLFSSSGYHLQEHVILDQEETLEAFEREDASFQIAKFAFYLPASLPPTMRFEAPSNAGSARIEYTLNVEYQHQQVLHRHHVNVVGAPASVKEFPYSLGPSSIPLKRHHHFGNLGSLAMAALVESTHVGKGDNLDMCLACKCFSRHEMDHLEVELIEHIEWSADGAKRSHDEISARLVHEPDEAGAEEKEVLNEKPSMERKGSWINRAHPLLSRRHSSNRGMLDAGVAAAMDQELRAPDAHLKIAVPLATRDSYEGTLLHVTHAIRITAFLKGRHQAPIPLDEVSIPIQVFDPPLTKQQQQTDHHQTRSTLNSMATTWPSDDEALQKPDWEHVKTETAARYPTIREIATE